jgi:hypothetical protein
MSTIVHPDAIGIATAHHARRLCSRYGYHNVRKGTKMRKTAKRLGGALAVSAALVGAMAFLGQGAANAASGGGCGAPVTANGVTATACINVEYGIAVHGDAYVSAHGAPGNCNYDLRFYKDNGAFLGNSGNIPCGTSHYRMPVALPVNPFAKYRSLVEVRFGEEVIIDAYSPIQNGS